MQLSYYLKVAFPNYLELQLSDPCSGHFNHVPPQPHTGKSSWQKSWVELSKVTKMEESNEVFFSFALWAQPFFLFCDSLGNFEHMFLDRL